MLFFKRIPFVFAAALMLAGCGTLRDAVDMAGYAADYMFESAYSDDDEMVITVDKNKRAPYAPEADVVAARTASAPAPAPAPAPAEVASAPLRDLSEQLSNDDVHVFSLDAPPVSFAPLGGTPAARDSSVVVYPLNGTYSSQPLQQGYRAQQNMQKPFVQGLAASPGTVYFGHGVTSLDAQNKQKVSAFVNHYKFVPQAVLQVDGHASLRTETRDPVQGRLVNLKVSMDRAMSVSKELIRDGVPPEAIRTTGWGDTRPSFDESTSRRVEISSGSY